MKPTNPEHTVLSVATERVDALLNVLTTAKVLPLSVPRDGAPRTTEIRIPRFDSVFRVSILSDLEPVVFDAIVPDALAPHIRFSVGLLKVACRVDLCDGSEANDPSPDILASYTMFLSGAASIALAAEPATVNAPLSVRIVEVVVRIDDVTPGSPLPFPKEDLSAALSRLITRDLQAQFGNTVLPRLPLLPGFGDALSLPAAKLHVRYAQPALSTDRFASVRCLPPTLGFPGCVSAPSVNIKTAGRLDVLMRTDGESPIDAKPLDLASNHVQLDVGIDVLRKALAAYLKTQKLEDEKTFAGFLRAKWKVTVSIRERSGYPDQAVINVHGHFDLQMKFLKVRTCKKKVFGKEISFPCGFTLDWVDLKTGEANAAAHIGIDAVGGNYELAVIIEDKQLDVDTTLLGFLVEIAVGALLSLLPIVGPVLSGLWYFGMLIVELLQIVLGIVVANAADPTVRWRLNQFLKHELFGNKLVLRLQAPQLDFSMRGLSLGTNIAYEVKE